MKTYYLARYRFYNQALMKLPLITRGSQSGLPIYRVHEDENVKLYRMTTKNITKYENIVKQRELCESKIEQATKALINELKYRGKIESEAKALKIRFTNAGFLNKEFWESLKSNASAFPNSKKYEFDGYNFRSRVELKIAEILKDMGLSYKYECMINMGNTTYYPDFVVYLEEFQCCFIIEYLGMLDSKDYVRHTKNKLLSYIENDIYPSRDLVLLCGNNNQMPTEFEIQAAISQIVSCITNAHLLSAA